MPRAYGQVKGRKYPADQPIVDNDKPAMRYCSQCKQLRKTSDFNHSDKTADGLAKVCKSCTAINRNRRKH